VMYSFILLLPLLLLLLPPPLLLLPLLLPNSPFHRGTTVRRLDLGRGEEKGGKFLIGVAVLSTIL